MEIQVKREALSEAFSIAQAIAPTRSTRPVLQNALLTASKDGVSVSATDMEIGITWKVDAEACTVMEEGSVLLSAARVAQIARSVEAEEMTLKEDGKSCVVKGGRSTFEVMTEAVEDFSTVPAAPEKVALEIEWEKFAGMVRKTIFAAARESTRYALNGVHMEAVDGMLEMVSTDGRRMALIREKVGKEVKMPAAIVPQKALAQVERLKAGEKEKLKIFIQERQIFFSTEQGTVVSRLVEGQFPAYKDVIPKDNDKKAVIERGMLLSAMRQAAIMTSEESKSVVMNFAGSELTVTGRSPEEGSSEVKVDMKYEGGEVEVRFNPQFVIDALSASESEKITIELKESSSPAAMKDGSGFLYVVMPIHIV